MKRRARVWLDRVLLTAWRACAESIEDRIHREAAQVGFFAMLSFVPLALLLVAAFGIVFEDAEVRTRVVKTVFENIPLSAEDDRARLESTVSDALRNAGRIGPFSIVLLIVAGTGIMGALRHTINEAWDIHDRPPLLRRKALDLSLVLGATLVLALSLSVTATRRAAEVLDDEEGGGMAASVLDFFGDALPFVFGGAVILFLYCVLPMHRQRPRDVWPGVLVAILLIALLREGLELYFEHLADFGALYGSLGALMALLLFVYAAAIVLLFGAEFASEWTRLPDKEETSAEVRRLASRVRGWRREKPGSRSDMPDITVHRHGDRWAVLEAGAESPSKEFPTREAAEMAARQMAAGGTVDVREDDPTGLEHTEPGDAGQAPGGPPSQTGGPGAPEGVRDRQAGL